MSENFCCRKLYFFRKLLKRFFVEKGGLEARAKRNLELVIGGSPVG